MKRIYQILFKKLPSLISCWRSGLKFDATWDIQGRAVVDKGSFIMRLLGKKKHGTIVIGNYFSCCNKLKGNSIGVIQRCLFNISADESQIKIGNHVGISGSTIYAKKSVEIGDNVLIGSGCLITDSDLHSLDYLKRREEDYSDVKVMPVVIGDDVFVGARSIILKGVTIGPRSIIGAGSVVTRDVPADTIVGGNPAIIVKQLCQEK